MIYVHHRIEAAPRQWQAVADALRAHAEERLGGAGGSLYGIWRSQIGRPRDELTAVTVWPDEDTARRSGTALCHGLSDVRNHEAAPMSPTLRPSNRRTAAAPGQLRLPLVPDAASALAGVSPALRRCVARLRGGV